MIKKKKVVRKHTEAHTQKKKTLQHYEKTKSKIKKSSASQRCMFRLDDATEAPSEFSVLELSVPHQQPRCKISAYGGEDDGAGKVC